MNWNDYIREILRKPSCFDNVVLSFENNTKIDVPPIIKASLFILDSITKTQGVHNVIVFPEKTQTSFIFAVLKVIYNVITGKIGYCYDPYRFTKGQKLKFKNFVMEFDTIEKDKNGEEKIFVWFSGNFRYGLPIEVAPYFQSTDTKRPLSKYDAFAKLFRIKTVDCKQISIRSNIVEFLSNHKTHIKSTVFYVTSIANAKELLKSIKINYRSIEDMLLIGQVDYRGEIRNAGSGQLAGTPAITLSPDLFSVIEATRRGVEVQSIILDLSNNILNAQLNVLDQLYRQKYPIVCVTDTEGSLELGMLEDRDFNIWRWNEESLTKDLYGSSSTILDKKLRNCANSVIEYCTAKSTEICDSLKLLYKHREDVKLQSPMVASIYGTLFEYTLTALKSITPISSKRVQTVRNELEECNVKLVDEKRYISDELYDSLHFVVENLFKIYSSDFDFPKTNMLFSKITDGNYKKINIIISEKEDKNNVYLYWKNKLNKNGIIVDIEILYPDEFTGNYFIDSDITV
ncbi:MAG: hypothetical protein GX957_04960, partial [Clostridiaceae bacterium]|nr:hypothetical protein [Clostridiaceae bacterium]